MNERSQPNNDQQSEQGIKAILFVVCFVAFVIGVLLVPHLALLLFCAFAMSLFFLFVVLPSSSSISDNKNDTKEVFSEAALQHETHVPLVEALQFPAYILDEKGKLIYANQPSIHVFGKTCVGDSILIRFRQPELRRMIENALAVQGSFSGEYHETIPGDRWFSVEITPIPNFDETTAKPLYLLGFHDLTETKKAEQMRSDFIANASHELRTPLASLLGYIETIKGPARKDEKAINRFTDVMLDQAQRMTRLVNDLLSLSRIETQAHVRPSDTIDLSEVLASVIGSLGSVATQLKVRIEFENPGIVNILGDRDELLQVFENLIENACKYGQEGKRVLVSLDIDRDQNEVTASVRDFGPGIALENQHRITERFYRVDVARSRAKQGTGLGLAIVKHILNRHATKIGIESKPDEGARFFVKFPLVEVKSTKDI